MRLNLWTMGLMLLASSTAYGDVFSPWHYIKNYNLGVDVGQTNDTASMTYRPGRGYRLYEHCESSSCIVDYERRTEGYGLYLEQPFKRQGFWHFDYDLGVAFRVIDGELDLVSPGAAPIRDFRMHLYSVLLLPYLRFGVTPRGLPDLLFSMGPSGELTWGSLNFDSQRYVVSPRGSFRRTSVMSIFSYRELELVLHRFGRGSFSLVYSDVYGDGYVEDGQIAPEYVNGMEDVSLSLHRNFVGAKVLFK